MRSTPQWIAWEGLGRAWDLPGIAGASRCGQLGHDLDLHVAVLQLPLVVLLDNPLERLNKEVKRAPTFPNEAVIIWRDTGKNHLRGGQSGGSTALPIAST
jgi:hypothetical protein